MLKKYITYDGLIKEIPEFEPGCWISLTDPTKQECEDVAAMYGIDIVDIRAAMDNEESSRIDVEEEYTTLLFDIPFTEIRHNQQAYTTIPLGIISTENVVITICTVDTPILKLFAENEIKGINTKKQMRFAYQILMRTCMVYQSYLRIIDRRRIEMEERISNITEDADIIALHELESTLVYFDTSLRANRLVLDRMSRYSRIRKYPEDQELLEDVIVENSQAIEMTQIYRDIIRGTRELMASVIDNRLNNAMKYLAAITIVMAIPTIISGLYGMNVDERWMPLSSVPFGFEIICGITVVICIIMMFILRKRKML